MDNFHFNRWSQKFVCLLLSRIFPLSATPKITSVEKVKKDENASYFGECVFDVHLNENFRNVRESFLWSFDWENVSFFL